MIEEKQSAKTLEKSNSIYVSAMNKPFEIRYPKPFIFTVKVSMFFQEYNFCFSGLYLCFI